MAVPFERATLTPEFYDLGVAATSFHWLPERRALRRVARALRPGGWWAAWNNHHGDPNRPSEFREALGPLYRKISAGRGSGGPTARALEKDRARRIAALESVDRFDHVSREEIRWSVTMDTARVKALWGTFSDVATLPAPTRRWFLGELAKLVEARFGGEVEIPMWTPMCTRPTPVIVRSGSDRMRG